MKIKPLGRIKQPTHVFHDGQWVKFENRKKSGRLSHMNKSNRKGPISEFLRECFKEAAHAY